MSLNHLKYSAHFLSMNYGRNSPRTETNEWIIALMRRGTEENLLIANQIKDNGHTKPRCASGKKLDSLLKFMSTSPNVMHSNILRL